MACALIPFRKWSVWVEENNGRIVNIKFLKKASVKHGSNSRVLHNFIIQFKEYISGKRKKFSVPFEMKGTEFDKKVYRILLKEASYGKVITYKDIAMMLGNKNLARAVGQSLRRNSLPLLIPCHRVIKSNGDIGGFSGGKELKFTLLSIEGVNIKRKE